MFGGQAGYNWKIDRWVWGLEADLQWTGQRGSTQFCLTVACPLASNFVNSESHLRWFTDHILRGGINYRF